VLDSVPSTSKTNKQIKNHGKGRPQMNRREQISEHGKGYIALWWRKKER
jgi:hypothetical protein